VIAGGTGGLGRAIAEWMVHNRGVKNLVLLSRSGMDNEAAARVVNKLNQTGARVVAPSCDITDVAALETVMAEISTTMPPVAGCIQASMILRVRTIVAGYYKKLTLR
jgi:NAD(P)-dependent dehydrogenase (short-subunit alcohol dehydrogenase family)